VKVLFIDTVAYKPYTFKTLANEALGGSEASLLRVAKGLAERGHEVAIFELLRAHDDEEIQEGVRFVHDSSELNPDIVVHFRTSKLVDAMRQSYPKARPFMWTQDLGGPHLADEPLGAAEIICVSDFHKEQFAEAAKRYCKEPHAPISRIHNPVQIDGLRYPKVSRRLGFFSSPHKGLGGVLLAFQNARANRPNLELVVGNPGYITAPEILTEGVTFLGELPHHRVMEEMSRCELLFYPQTIFPETFGIVLAEANAMGTLVLSHRFGAAHEVLAEGSNGGNYVTDCTHEENVARGLEVLLKSQAKVGLDPRFALSAVIDEWEKLLGE
jgi:glycosyltransferase involved in cell wall biosynthesis